MWKSTVDTWMKLDTVALEYATTGHELLIRRGNFHKKIHNRNFDWNQTNERYISGKWGAVT